MQFNIAIYFSQHLYVNIYPLMRDLMLLSYDYIFIFMLYSLHSTSRQSAFTRNVNVFSTFFQEVEFIVWYYSQ
jgi:hypothetical protein